MRMLFLAFAALAACNPYDPNLGPTPFLCGSGTPQCPEGYTCQSQNMKMVCVKPGAATPDAGNPNGSCADDSMIEGASRNDTIATAFDSKVATSACSIPYSGLAICPSGDKDYYMVQLNAIMTIQADMTYTAMFGTETGPKLSVTIVNQGGTTIANPQPGLGTNEYTATAANLPSGAYYVLVQVDPSVTTGETRNNYSLKITASGGGSCL